MQGYWIVLLSSCKYLAQAFPLLLSSPPPHMQKILGLWESVYGWNPYLFNCRARHSRVWGKAPSPSLIHPEMVERGIRKELLSVMSLQGWGAGYGVGLLPKHPAMEESGEGVWGLGLCPLTGLEGIPKDPETQGLRVFSPFLDCRVRGFRGIWDTLWLVDF